ncbi:hypothetical protein MIB92_16215 [Aestuariirhabdus sp. Z084]|uniref:hypothetical protein n=1 Tax=Aestuariirhabdus haliotis TaxID=2918751 RepID=UPI00201B3598|nr:hypothetical protein [Aestuariirhabdus haliotis]MCL6417206.1 hypothetical protein [Aestuariirhabdus haliotis]MCL6421178.1 hypothetical protein [Aestuariirhabdus haliotis]
MRFFLLFCGFVILSFQVALTYAWVETPMLRMFIDTFNGLYEGGIPVWSNMAFSWGKWWYFTAAMLLVALVYGFVIKRPVSSLLILVLASFLSVASMLYAMYPIHLMMQVSI